MARKTVLIVSGSVFFLYICLTLTGLFFAKHEIKQMSLPKDSASIEDLFKRAKRIRRDVFLVRPFFALNKNFSNKLNLVDQLLEFEPIYKSLAGVDQEKTYLMVMQNNAEIRPSGGIWGSYGILKVKDGKITSLKTDDTYYLDKDLVGRFSAPEEVADIVGDQWRFWNANWSPDFKISAEQGLFFFEKAQPATRLDGVIGPNVDFILSLLDASGPVKLTNHGVTLDKNNFVEKMIYEPNSQAVLAAVKDPKLISGDEKNYVLSDIAISILNQIINNKQQVALAEKTFSALENRDLLLYSADPEIQKGIEKRGWAGRMPGGGNFVYIADANLGSKLDFLVEKHIKVEKTAENQYKAILTYKNLSLENKDLAGQIFKNYRDYVRLYFPKNSKLTALLGGQNSTEMKIDDKTSLAYAGAIIILEPGQEKSLSFEWEPPQNLALENLKILKQPGTRMKTGLNLAAE